MEKLWDKLGTCRRLDILVFAGYGVEVNRFICRSDWQDLSDIIKRNIQLAHSDLLRFYDELDKIGGLDDS